MSFQIHYSHYIHVLYHVLMISTMTMQSNYNHGGLHNNFALYARSVSNIYIIIHVTTNVK